MLKDGNYYVIHGWMINSLKLSGVELQIYAIIYGFSQDGRSEFNGSISYLMEWTGKARHTVIDALKSLTEKGYVIKKENEVANHIKLVSYKASQVGVDNCTGGAEIALGRCKNYTGGGAKIAPNINRDINSDNNSARARKSMNGFNNYKQRNIDYDSLIMKGLI